MPQEQRSACMLEERARERDAHRMYMTLKPTNHVSLASEITINVFYVLMLDHVRLATAISRWTELRRQDVLAC